MRLIQYLLFGVTFAEMIINRNQLTDFIPVLILLLICQLLWFYSHQRASKMILLFGAIIILIATIYQTQSLQPYLLASLMIDVLTNLTDYKKYLAMVILVCLSLATTYLITNSLVASQVILLISLLSVIILTHHYQNQNQVLTQQLRQQSILLNQIEKQQQTFLSDKEASAAIQILQERNRISRDLHDSIGHTLSTLIIQLEALTVLAHRNHQPQLAKMAGQLREFTKTGMDEVRSAIYDLKPENYQAIAFIEQCQQIVANFNQQTHIRADFNYNHATFQITPIQQEALYRALQETLSNVMKHAEATKVHIQLHYTYDEIILTLQDNGQGTDKIIPSVGLTGMKERIQLAGGKVAHFSQTNRGFQTRLVMERRQWDE